MTISFSVVIATVITIASFLAALIAFTPTYITGIDGVRSAVANLRVNIIRKARSEIQSILSPPATAMAAYALNHVDGVVNISTLEDKERMRLLCSLALPYNAGRTAMFMQPYVPEGEVFFSMCDNRGDAPHGTHANSQQITLYLFDLHQRLLLLDHPTFQFVMPQSATQNNQSFGKASYLLNAYGEGVVRWLPAEVGFDSFQYTIGFAAKDRFGGQGAITLDVLTTGFEFILHHLDLSRRSRGFIYDETSGYVVANSWNESVGELLPDYADLSKPLEERVRVRALSDYEDPLIRDAIGYMGGVQSFLKDVEMPYASTMGSGKDRTFINVENITDEFGLNMRVIIVMPELDFMEDTYKSRDMTIGIVVACLVVMVVASILFSVAIARPIDRIALRMYKTASLQDDDDDDTHSMLTEVRAMQDAYGTMKAELNRLKSYLPQSVLCAEDEEEEEESDVNSKISSVALQSSTLSHPAGVSDTTSNTHTTLSASRVGAGALNTKSGVSNKRVVVLVFNLIDFHTITQRAASAAQTTRIQASFLSLVNRLAREGKGVVDTFQGDHIIVSFNAVNNIACPARRAASVALHVVSEAAKDPHLPRISVGLTQGIALVGNTGCQDLQRFNIIGPVYNQAMVLERLAAQTLRRLSDKQHLILFDDPCFGDISLECYVQAVDLDKTKKQDRNGTIIYALMQPKSSALATDTEWMYQLEAGDNADPYAGLNSVFSLIQQDELIKAREGLVDILGGTHTSATVESEEQIKPIKQQPDEIYQLAAQRCEELLLEVP